MKECKLSHLFFQITISSTFFGAATYWLLTNLYSSNDQELSLFSLLTAIIVLLTCLVVIIVNFKSLKNIERETFSNQTREIESDQTITDSPTIKKQQIIAEDSSKNENNQQISLKISKIKDTGNEENQGILRDVFEAYGITQKMIEEHLKTVTDDTNKAASELIEEFITIFESMKELRDIVLKEKDQSEQYSEAIINSKNKNKEMVNSIQTVLDKKLTEIQTDQELMQSLIQQAHSLSNLTALIQRISHQTKILAINAKVVAGKSGESGNQFGVIASEVGNLSYESAQASKKIESAITQLIVNIENGFSHKLDTKQQENESTVLKDVNSQLSNLASEFDQLVEVHQQTLQQLDINSKEVSDKVQESFTTIQFQDITQQQIEVVVKGLTLYQQYLSDIAQNQENQIKSTTKFDIEQFQKLYVISKQYQTHDKVTNKDSLENNDSSQHDEDPDGDITFF